MAIPFFDLNKSRIGFVWCVRCKDWIPLKEAYGVGFDPHIYDHGLAYQELKKLHESPIRNPPTEGISPVAYCRDKNVREMKPVILPASAESPA